MFSLMRIVVLAGKFVPKECLCGLIVMIFAFYVLLEGVFVNFGRFFLAMLVVGLVLSPSSFREGLPRQLLAVLSKIYYLSLMFYWRVH